MSVSSAFNTSSTNHVVICKKKLNGERNDGTNGNRTWLVIYFCKSFKELLKMHFFSLEKLQTLCFNGANVFNNSFFCFNRRVFFHLKLQSINFDAREYFSVEIYEVSDPRHYFFVKTTFVAKRLMRFRGSSQELLPWNMNRDFRRQNTWIYQ